MPQADDKFLPGPYSCPSFRLTLALSRARKRERSGRCQGVGSSAWFGAGPARALRLARQRPEAGYRRPKRKLVASGPHCSLCMQPAGMSKVSPTRNVCVCPFPRQCECARQNKAAGVKGMGVWCLEDVGHPLSRFDLQIALTLPGSCELCGVHRSVLPQDQMITKTTLGARLWRVRLHVRADHATLLQETPPIHATQLPTILYP